MKFIEVRVEEAQGLVLAHNVTDGDGRRILRKGKRLDAADIERLVTSGRKTIHAARLDADDVDENEAALQITRAVISGPLRLSGPSTGRVNVYAEVLGVVQVEVERLVELNSCEGVTLSVVRSGTVARPGRMVGTTKILPYALSQAIVDQATSVGRDAVPLELTPLPATRASLVVTSSAANQDKIVRGFESALGERLLALNSKLERVEHVPVGDDTQDRLKDRIIELRRDSRSPPDLLILAGETAIQDRHDIAPSALEDAGGTVHCFGAPVDPGNLLMLGELDGIPVLGAPGCARSPKANIVDLVLPRLLVGEKLTHRDIIELGHGGLLDDVPERPLPRSQI